MTERTVDLLVAGGGVFGLWIARRALQAGLSVMLVERRRVGWGASGGLLGALTAHTPDRWNEKKAFQFAALVELEGEIDRLEAETGASAGFGRTGRVMPIATEAFLGQVAERTAGAAERWRSGGRVWTYEARRDARQEGWLSAEAAPLGYAEDTLAARVAPGRYLAALASAVTRAGGEIREDVGFVDWDGSARLSDGEAVRAGAVALSAGFESFPMLERVTGRDLGGGIQGQTALFERPGFENRPLIYTDGIYVAPHGDGTIAVGSTDRKGWEAADAVDLDDVAFIARAQALCPAISGLRPVRRWAGVRPKAWTRDPLIGRLPGAPPLWAATGGFKISFGIAHRIAAALIDRIVGAERPTPVPERFEIAAHLAAAERRSPAPQST
ncbi:MAG: FAD-dependent oxidoreductase [Pseudomonadota bacterium]